MRNIVFVEVKSTGVNFIQDAVYRNYYPIVLQTKLGDGEYAEEYREETDISLKKVKEDFELIFEKDSYEETLEMVREYDPVLVIPANERGVILATKLANDLNLLCNPIENLDAMTLKDKMQDKLAENGLRHIRGKVVRSVDEAIEYYDNESLNEVVIKPVYGAASVGVRICLNRKEMIDVLTEQFKGENYYGDEIKKYLVQERIDGEEYIVNTVSNNGVHRITTIWKYKKQKTSEGGQIYDYAHTINDLNIGEASLVEYAYKVCDAIGIKYGAVHGEYMIDDKGPILIEVNCRPMGANLDAEFLDKISGQHETDSTLDSYLNPDKFEFERLRGYKLYEHGAIKILIIPRDIIAESSSMNHVNIHLKSHFYTSINPLDDPKLFVKTQDLRTAAGTIYLSHPDGYVLQKDIEFIRSIEKNAFHLVLSDESSKKTTIDENETFDDIKSLLNKILAYGVTLFVTDNVFEDINVLQISPDRIDDISGEFNCVVVNLNKSIINKKDDEISLLLLKIINKVKNGGLIFIPESTYQYVPNRRIGVEALIKVLDLEILLPLHDMIGFIIAQK
ncbi:ATP-grasp domain-containing protein [Methanobrevibacter sp.]|uniref:ATP-grasp domain-containing protein n=1 Tax=Methanobrevibacter sp. TaxID=66852 RepID=UPI00388ECB03